MLGNMWYMHTVNSVSHLCLTLRPYGLQHARLPWPSPTPRVIQTHFHWISDAIQPSHPLLPLLLPPIFPSIRAFAVSQFFSSGGQSIGVSASAISPCNEYSELISFRMDWFDLPAVQGILQSLLQHHSSKASILQCSAFFIVQLSHPYMTTEKP